MKLISNKRNTTCFLYYLQNKNLVYLEIITIITVIKTNLPATQSSEEISLSCCQQPIGYFT